MQNLSKKIQCKKIQFIYLLLSLASLCLLFSSNVYAGRLNKLYNSDTTSGFFVVKKINIEGNERTKSQIILRELTFNSGDTLTLSNIDDHIKTSKNNLLKTPLFNYVTITSKIDDDESISFNIAVEERWYIWPTARIAYADRNFSSWLKHKDIMRVNYGMGISKYNFRERNEILRFKFTLGYREFFTVYYRNLFLDKDKKHSIGFDFSYARQNEVNYNAISNKEVAIKSDTDYLMNHKRIVTLYTWRPKLYSHHQFWFQQNFVKVSDTVKSLNPEFLSSNKRKMNYFNFTYRFIFDKRNSKAYPLNGSYFNFYFDYYLSVYSANENINYATFKFVFNKFRQLYPRLFIASGNTIKFATNQNQPFFILEGLGHRRDYLRGYEYYLIEGQHFLLSKNLIKFNLIPKIVRKMEWLSWKKFNKIHFSVYSNLYFDAGYVIDNTNKYKEFNNTYVNDFLYSYGLGLDFVTYYDKVLRVEYSLTKHGHSGIFIHFLSPI